MHAHAGGEERKERKGGGEDWERRERSKVLAAAFEAIQLEACTSLNKCCDYMVVLEGIM